MVPWAITIVLFDLLAKFIAWHYFPNLVSTNTAVAFGIGSVHWLTYGLLITLTLLYLTRAQPRSVWISLTLGIAANILDRLVYGRVIDYISLASLHFNLADCLILFCIGRLLYLNTFKKDTV